MARRELNRSLLSGALCAPLEMSRFVGFSAVRDDLILQGDRVAGVVRGLAYVLGPRRGLTTVTFLSGLFSRLAELRGRRAEIPPRELGARFAS